MTKTTEELKREMYDRLKNLIQREAGSGWYGARNLEESLEAYLEALRQERAEALKHGEILRDAYMLQQQRTMQATEEAIRERNRCQAFEFANKSAGEFLKESQRLLKEARESVKRQRQSIGQLKRDRNDAQHTLKVRDRQLLEARVELQEARKFLPATHTQDEEENPSCAKCGGTKTVLCGADAPGAFLFLDICPECEERS